MGRWEGQIDSVLGCSGQKGALGLSVGGFCSAHGMGFESQGLLGKRLAVKTQFGQGRWLRGTPGRAVCSGPSHGVGLRAGERPHECGHYERGDTA